MKQNFGKLLSLMLAVILLLSSAVGIEAAAEASDTAISEINLTDNAPQPVAGEQATQYSYTHTEAGVEIYTITGEWYVFDTTVKAYLPMESTDTFADDKAYNIDLIISPEEGYTLENNFLFKINGEENNHGYFDEGSYCLSLYYSKGTAIQEITLDESIFPKAEIGKTFTSDDIDVAVPAGSNFTIRGYWRDEDNDNTSGTFENGKAYSFYYNVYANAGYCFPENYVIFNIGDESFIVASQQGKMSVGDTRRSSFKTKISTVELLNVPTAEVGKKIEAADAIDIDVPVGANYTAEAAWYYNGMIAINESMTVEKGKSYMLAIDIYANEGYEFSEEVIVKTDGASHKLQGGYEHCYLTRDYNFETKIEKVEVTGITVPVIGATPTIEGLKVADADKYEIVHAEWSELADNGYVPVAKFEDGHAYELIVSVAPKEGYSFTNKTVLSINGEESYNYLSNTIVDLYASFSFKKDIEEVRIENAPVMKVGETATVTGIKVPEGAKYNASAVWHVYNEATEEWENFSGVFEKGKTYSLDINVMPAEGYATDPKKTSFYVNGNKISDNDINPLFNATSIQFEFTEGAKVIERLEITVEEPVIGDHSSMDPVITLPKDANYHISELYSVHWIFGDEEKIYIFGGYFNADDSYGTYFYLAANEGYIFAEDLVVIVNGKVLSNKAVNENFSKTVNIRYFFNAECQHIYADDNDDTCDACGAKREVVNTVVKSPNTGDNTATVLLATIIALSAVIIVCKGRKTKI